MSNPSSSIYMRVFTKFIINYIFSFSGNNCKIKSLKIGIARQFQALHLCKSKIESTVHYKCKCWKKTYGVVYWQLPDSNLKGKDNSMTSMREIAELTGVGVGNIYNYFTNKDELFRRWSVQFSVLGKPCCRKITVYGTRTLWWCGWKNIWKLT